MSFLFLYVLYPAVKIENIFEILDSDDEGVGVQPKEQEEKIVQNNNITQIDSRAANQNDDGANRADIVDSFLVDHQYAKKQASTDPLDESQAQANENSTGNHNDEYSVHEFGVEHTLEVETNDGGTLTETTANSECKQDPEANDLTSNKDELANTTMDNGQNDDADAQGQSRIQRERVYNTRNAGNFKPGRWQKSDNHLTSACKDLKCEVCHKSSNKKKRPHKCTTCGRRFARKQSLIMHARIHAKQFLCQIEFPDAKSCKSHTDHCKFTRFECHLCKKSFCDTGKRSKHVCNIHIDKPIHPSTRPTQFRSKFRIVLKEFQI